MNRYVRISQDEVRAFLFEFFDIYGLVNLIYNLVNNRKLRWNGMAIVQGERVNFSYDEEGPRVLHDVSFTIDRGKWIAIVGHNGSGKSTLAKLMIGLYLPTEGSLKMFGEDYTEQNVWNIRERIGVVFQNPDNQFVGTTVQDDVAFSLENRGVPYEEMRERVMEVLRQVSMEQFLDAEPHHLSGGQKQRVAIAGAIALHPELLILDEATSMLDPQGREDVMRTVTELKETTDVTVISITHDLEEVLLADEVLVMNEGKLLFQTTPEEMFRHGKKLEEIGLDLPFTLRLANLLEREEINVAHELTEEKLVEQLWTLYFNK